MQRKYRKSSKKSTWLIHEDFYDLKFRKEKQKPQSLERISKDEYRQGTMQLLKDKIITSVLRMRYN